MTSILSDWAREFLREDHVAVVSTLNTDGSPQVTTIWYLLQVDGTLIMSTPGRTQKVKNLRRDPGIADHGLLRAFRKVFRMRCNNEHNTWGKRPNRC